MTPESFPAFLRQEVLRLGSGRTRAGERRVATALGVSERSIRSWTAGGGKPSIGLITGAHFILPGLVPVRRPAPRAAQ